MRIRHDALFISSVLLTIALLSLVSGQLMNALPGGDMASTDVWAKVYAKSVHEMSVINLAVISIALIVIWTGYVRSLRSSWFIMFIIVGFWFFPQTSLWYVNYSHIIGGLAEAAKDQV